jgi:hypothetical protein
MVLANAVTMRECELIDIRALAEDATVQAVVLGAIAHPADNADIDPVNEIIP